MEPDAEQQMELERLRQTVRGLTALSRLAAEWVTYDISAVLNSLADNLVNILDLEAVYVRSAGLFSVPFLEVARCQQPHVAAPAMKAIRQALASLTATAGEFVVGTIPNPLGEGKWQTCVTTFGPSPNQLVVAACSAKSDFPTEPDRVLLSSVTNQAALVLGQKHMEQELQKERDARQRTSNPELEDSDERYRLISEAANDAIWDWDLASQLVTWNSGVRSRFGHSFEQVGSNAAWWVDHIHSDDRERVVHGIHAAIEGSADTWSDEYRFARADGSYAYVFDRGRIMRNKVGQGVRMVGSMLDLTDRRMAEQALRESELRFRTLFESMDEGYCIIEMIFDRDGRPIDYLFQLTNPAFEKQSGLKDAAGRRMRELAPDHDEHWFQIYGNVAITGQAVRVVNEAKRLNRWFDVYATRMGGPGSHLVAVLFNDITQRRQSDAERERLLREVETERERLMDVFQRAPSFMCVLRGPDHVIERANDRYLQLIGHREVIGKPIRQALPEVVGQGFVDLLDGVFQTGEPFIGVAMQVLLRRTADDPLEEHHIDFVYQALREPDGAISGVLVQGVDLTERKRAETALRENELQFRAFVEQVQDYAIFMIDAAGCATSWNEGVRQVLGYDENEFLGKEIAPRIFTPEDFVKGVPQAEMSHAAATGSANDDRWMQRKDGTRFFAAGITSALRNDSGELIGYIKVMRDQTRQKHLEDDLRRIAAELSEGNRRKDEFLATLAHELRNPLAPISTGLELMRMAADNRPLIDEIRNTMEEQTQQLVRLVDDLLDVSRITSGKVKLRIERVELASVVRSAVDATRSIVDQARHQLTTTLPERPIYLDGDATRLTQIFSNLLTNAAKYTPPGGSIWLSAERRSAEVLVVVRDTGIGIPPGMLENIFDMFTQVDHSLERSSSGLGIGLTLVKRLVEMHQGRIHVRSDGENQGSEFLVYLPALSDGEPIAEPALATTQTAVPLSHCKVLLVDDNKSAANLMSMVIKLQGHEVRVAHDGLEALAIAADFHPQIVFMDLGMPKLNGFEAARRIREHDWGKPMILVALTGWGQEEDKQRTREAGFDHHLVKPADPADLRRILALADLHQGGDDSSFPGD